MMEESYEMFDRGCIGSQGFGCMGLSHLYGIAHESESLATLNRAIELGVTLFDTADMYGFGHNESLLARAIAGRRSKLSVCSKFGFRMDKRLNVRVIDGSPAYARKAVEASLGRLSVEYIDLYYLHRLDPWTPIEDTIGALARLKQEGKIRAIGLSEVSAEVLRRAHRVHHIAALQSEYSLWSREVEDEILPTCRALGVRFVAYSPLGRGFLAGTEVVDAEDRRRRLPRFQPDAIKANRAQRAVVERIAAGKGVSAAQVSLAWVLSKGVVAIPGTRHIHHLEENLAAASIRLGREEITELERAFGPGSTIGARYPQEELALVPTPSRELASAKSE